MQTGSNAQAMLTLPLQQAIASSDPQAAIDEILMGLMKAVGAIGVSASVSREPASMWSVGRTPTWAEPTVLADWATKLPDGISKNSDYPEQTKFPACYTVNLPGKALVCLWFRQADGQIDEEVISVFSSVFYLLVDRFIAQQKQQLASALTQSILSSIADPLLVLSEERRLLMMNPAAEMVFQVPASEAVGRSLSDVVNDDKLLALVNSPPEDHRPPEWSIVLEDEEFTFLPLMSVIKSADDQPNGWALALRDVSRFKRLNHNQQEFMRIVSHDLRSPLTSMQGFADMIRMGMVGDVTDKQVYFVDKILSGINQMTAIVENIQDAGRFDIETGFYEMERQQVDLSDMAASIVQNHIIPAEKQELTLELRVDDRVPILYVDENMLTRAVTNLVDNAIKYTPNGGRVEVSIERREDDVLINVADDGYGISEENQRRLFQRHVRLERKEHRQVKGTGLGLFIVRSVAQRHGGAATVQSIMGEGTTFTIRIPLREPNLTGKNHR